MFVRSAAAAALDRKKELFSTYDHERREEKRRMKGWLEELKADTAASLNRKLDDAIDSAWPGALPTAEFDRAAGMRIPLGAIWQNREQARHWALETLEGRPALAVDGSQIVPTTDYSPPVGAVQIGWFFNDRGTATDGDAAGRYEKDIAFEVLAPDELLDSDSNDDFFPNWRVNQERFILECAKLCEFMERCAERPFERRPVCFFDGSLIISFAGQLRAGREHGYIQAVQKLLACSERTRTPLVGYVDNTYSRDLVTLLAALHGLVAPAQINDAYLLRETLSSWGDRSPFWICARPDRLSDTGRADFYKQVCFCLARVSMENPPVRLEIPRWLLESGRADEIVALVLAEAVVGGGYPYVLEAADVTAVIQQQDRQRFYRLYQDFLQEQGMAMTITRKQRSKQMRR
ncbi:MAG: DNA double-strand break repair nuclease NurA [Caldilineaceae bacterium]|nr:DNA double-strand break repair nuclease NurA [Caldilineaceae bacterium]MDE0336378.1 DNA double-strand break repair nuclease NurA [Caldilineaceae bacterium]